MNKTDKFITFVEFVILNYLAVCTRFSWIARDQDGFLCVYDRKPHKERNPDCVDSDYWICDGTRYDIASMAPFNSLFQNIKWEDEEPTLIEEASEGYGL